MHLPLVSRNLLALRYPSSSHSYSTTRFATIVTKHYFIQVCKKGKVIGRNYNLQFRSACELELGESNIRWFCV